MAESGLAVFPSNERLERVRTFAKKQELSGRLRHLKQETRLRPSPEAYTELATIYRDLGDDGAAMETAAICAKRYPRHEGPHLITGQLRLDRFVRDKVAKDVVLAHEALERVLTIDKHSTRASLMLAEIHYLVGDMRRCREHLQQVVALMPSARHVHAFLRAGEGRTRDDSDPGLRSLAERVEQRGEFANPVSGFPRTGESGGGPAARKLKLDTSGLRAQLGALGNERGIANVIVMDREGDVLADHAGASGMDREDFCELVASIGETSDDASRRMDIGTLVRAEIVGPGANLTVARLRSLTVAVLYNEPLKPDEVWTRVQDFVARNLTAGGDTAGA